MNVPFTSDNETGLKRNPLVRYLKIFQKQHKVISVLYRGLIVSFCGFILLLSFLIFTVFDSHLIPSWGKITLITIDVFLLFGVCKAFYELGKYRRKSILVLEQVYDFLKNDLAKYEKMKSEHASISQSNKRLQNKILSFTSKSKSLPIENYQGWDYQICPNCHATLEMMTEVCPQCRHNLGKIFTN